jgi:hypothetical protein
MKRILTPPRTLGQINSFYQSISKNIECYGFHIQGVLASQDTPPFNYTIGLSEILGFELFMCGLRNDAAAHIMTDLAKIMISRGEHLPDCVVPKEIVANQPLMVATCTKELEWLWSDFTIQIERYYGTRRMVVQVLMSDKEGRVPTDEDFDIEYMAKFQPIFCEV